MVEVVVTAGAIGYAKGHNNKPTPNLFYRLDALPVTQPTVSKH